MNLAKSLSNRVLNRTVFTSICLTLAPMSMAADLNTYRSGNVYLKAQASNSNMCESQCSGDAQCKGWNFLRSGAPNGSGICEFNDQIGNAVQHPYAISDIATGQKYSDANIVQGQTNTVRIGQPVTVRSQSQYTHAQIAPQMTPQIRSQATRQLQPQYARTIAASTRPAPQQVRQPALNTLTRQRVFAPQAAPQTAPQPQMGTESLSLLEQQKRQGANASGIAVQSPQVRQQSQPKMQAQPQYTAAPSPQAQTYIAPTAQQPSYAQYQYEAQRQAQQNAQMQPQHRAQQRPPMVMGDATSLYGSLYDAPNAPVQAAKLPLYNEYVAAQPDAPIVTSPVAVPTAPVYETPLSMVGAAPRN